MSMVSENTVESGHPRISSDFLETAQRKGGILALFWHHKLLAFMHYTDGNGTSNPNDPIVKVIATDDLNNSEIVKSNHSPLPAVIHNLHPALSFIGQILNITTRSGYVGQGKRAFSNFRLFKIKSVEDLPEVKTEDMDILKGRLRDHKSKQGTFTGLYKGLAGIVGNSDFDKAYKAKWEEIISIVFSGKERKIPLYLSSKGTLFCASDKRPFTHIGKFPEKGGRESMAVLEYMGMEVSKAMGMQTAECALIDQGPYFPPMYVTERTDIPESENDVASTWRIIQDMWSIAGIDPESASTNLENVTSYETILNRWIGINKTHAPDSIENNVKEMLRRIIGSSIICDNDLHAKNMSGLFEFDAETLKIKSLKFAPVYDAVVNCWASRNGTPLHYKLLNSDRSKPTKLGMHEFLSFLKQKNNQINGKQYCVFETEAEARQFILEIAEKAARKAIEMTQNPPDCVLNSAYREILLLDMNVGAALIVEKAKALGVKDLEFDTAEIWKANKANGGRVRAQAYERQTRILADERKHHI